MTTYTVLIFLNAASGREEEFHDWYEQTHVDDVLRTAGFRSGQRFGLEHVVGLPMPNTHLAVYEADAETPEEVIERLNSTRDQRDMQMDLIDASQVAFWVFSPLGEPHVAD